MDGLLVSQLEQKSRALNRSIDERLARLKFASLLHRVDDETKSEMMDIIVTNSHDRRKGLARVKAFLARRAECAFS